MNGNPISLVDPLGLASGVRICYFGVCSPPIGGSGGGSSSSGDSSIECTQLGMCNSSNGSSASGSDSSAQSSENSTNKACPPSPGNQDPCKGLREQLRAHEVKLQGYIGSPSSFDTDGRLAAAYAANNMARVQNIISGRIRNLQGQIDNFRKQLEECERINGPR